MLRPRSGRINHGSALTSSLTGCLLWIVLTVGTSLHDGTTHKLGKAITCFEWGNVYVYDFNKGRFEANWADVPSRGEPYLRLRVHLLVIFVTLFTALALITFSHLGKFLRQKDRY
jgi:hypothetical protein